VAVTLKALATCEDFELVTLYVGAADDEVRADGIARRDDWE
jgi:hypothetical protein